MFLTEFTATFTRGMILFLLYTHLPYLSQSCKLFWKQKGMRDVIFFLNKKCPLPITLNYSPDSSLHFSGQLVPLDYERKCRHRFKKCMLWGQLTDYCSRNSISQPQVSPAQRQTELLNLFVSLYLHTQVTMFKQAES